MLSLTSHIDASAGNGADSISSSLIAFTSALAGAAVTSRLVFDHQIPSQPEDVVTYLATLGATVIAGWWLANVLAWTLALRQGVHLDRFTLPGTKRIAQFALAATLSTSCIADTNGDPVMVLVEQATASSTTLPSTETSPETGVPTTTPAPTPTTIDAPEPSPIESRPDVEESDTTDPSPSETDPEEAFHKGTIELHQVVVSEGDNLWSLTADALVVHGVEAPSCGQIAEYWRLVVAANRVQSGNPDLLGVGETVTMPAIDLSVFDVSSFHASPGTSTRGPQAGDLAIR